MNHVQVDKLEAFVAKFGPGEFAKSKQRSADTLLVWSIFVFSKVFLRNQNLRPNSQKRLRLQRPCMEGRSSKKASLANFINLEPEEILKSSHLHDAH
jgi:hypothetical protein